MLLAHCLHIYLELLGPIIFQTNQPTKRRHNRLLAVYLLRIYKSLLVETEFSVWRKVACESSCLLFEDVCGLLLQAIVVIAVVVEMLFYKLTQTLASAQVARSHTIVGKHQFSFVEI